MDPGWLASSDLDLHFSINGIQFKKSHVHNVIIRSNIVFQMSAQRRSCERKTSLAPIQVAFVT